MPTYVTAVSTSTIAAAFSIISFVTKSRLQPKQAVFLSLLGNVDDPQLPKVLCTCTT